MNVINFLSEGIYIILPSPSNPKVYLAIQDKRVAKLSFQLYNPFSLKGKLLKLFVSFFCVYFNSIAKFVLPTIKSENSGFLIYLNNKFNLNFTCSLYMATANDKVVLQLISNYEIFGYLKFPLNDFGKNRLLNERKAILLLSQYNLVSKIIASDRYLNIPFLIFKNIEGSSKKLESHDYKPVLNSLKKEKKFQLKNHPRILELRKELKFYSLNFLLDDLDSELLKSNKYYFEVFEHGDFAPWNLIKTEKFCIPFDFEYFEEIGLEYMDEFKYHFQIQRLLNGEEGAGLINILRLKLNIEEFAILFKIFLIKEIIILHKNKLSYEFERSLFKMLNHEKA